jgi:hypothetical protein
MPPHPSPTGPRGTGLTKKLQAALILKGVVRIVLDEGPAEVEPRTWYRESGTHYLEARWRDSGEHMRVRVDEIRDVVAY